MTTATKRSPKMHCDDGVVTMADIVFILNDVWGKPEDIDEIVKREARIAAEQFGQEYLAHFEDWTMTSTIKKEKDEFNVRLSSFITGYVYAKTGKFDY